MNTENVIIFLCVSVFISATSPSPTSPRSPSWPMFSAPSSPQPTSSTSSDSSPVRWVHIACVIIKWTVMQEKTGCIEKLLLTVKICDSVLMMQWRKKKYYISIRYSKLFFCGCQNVSKFDSSTDQVFSKWFEWCYQYTNLLINCSSKCIMSDISAVTCLVWIDKTQQGIL